jgi:hypothetical protein
VVVSSPQGKAEATNDENTEDEERRKTVEAEDMRNAATSTKSGFDPRGEGGYTPRNAASRSAEMRARW